MENIAKFLEGCEKLGCPKHDLFQTIDLYENKNPGQVVDAIHSLSRHAAKAGCDVPVLFSSELRTVSMLRNCKGIITDNHSTLMATQ
jgi:hypothetical protein